MRLWVWALVGLMSMSSFAAKDLAPAPDGWSSWEVPAVTDAPFWCCFRWEGGDSRGAGCNLDGVHGRTSRVDADPDPDPDPDPDVGRVRVYARHDGGVLSDIRAYAAACPVASQASVSDLGVVDVSSSIALINPATVSPDLVEEAAAAVAIHKGAEAREVLLGQARSSGSSKVRRSALFWLAQVRPNQVASELEDVALNDPSAKIRQHAAFAISQSALDSRGELLARQGRGDEDAKVRAKAWFWLAQSGAGNAEKALSSAFADEPEKRVREEILFAISQLPNASGVDHLIAVAKDRAVSDALRKKAVFWLAQSKAPSALEFFDQVLASR